MSTAGPPSYTTDEILPLLTPSIVRDIASLIAQSVLYGCFLATLGVAVYSLLKQRRNLSATMIMTASTFALFTIASFLWASDVAILVRRLDIVFVQTDSSMMARIMRANASTAKIRYMNDVMFAIAYLIGDAVIAWRVLCLWQWEVIVGIVLTTLWIGAAATGFGLIGCLVQNDFPTPSSLLPKSCTSLGNSSWTISLVLNLVSVGLMAWIAFVHRKDTRRIRDKRKSKVDRVLRILVAAGAAYFLLGVPRLTSFANPSLNPAWTRLSYATQIIESMLYQLVGLYPTAVTACLLFESQLPESHTDTTGSGVQTQTGLFNKHGDLTSGDGDLLESGGGSTAAVSTTQYEVKETDSKFLEPHAV